MSYIEVRDIQKTFLVRKKRQGHLLREKQKVTALDKVSFSVERGELLGYIGPNGAGKSTTVKILTGILTPESGVVSIGGRTPWKERREHVRHIGVVFGQRTQLWWDVPVSDSFDLLRDVYAIPADAYRKRRNELADALDIGSLLSTPLRLLSLGQRMRCELAGSLLHSPELLFLDEPTIGLDAVSKIALREFLLRENRVSGTTIMLTTHDMDDIEALCSRVMVLGHGKKLFDGALQELTERYDTTRYVYVEYPQAEMRPVLPPECACARDGDGWRITYSPAKTDTGKLLSCLQSGGVIRQMTMQPQNIDHMIAEMYREMDI